MGQSISDLRRLMTLLEEEHRAILNLRMPALRDAVDLLAQAANSDACSAAPELCSAVVTFHANLQRLCEREERGLFPMLRRLLNATVVSQCHAGLVQSRVKFATLEQEAVSRELDQLASLAGCVGSPPGTSTAAIAAQIDVLRHAIDALRHAIDAHVRHEQQILFPSVVELEQTLTQRGREGTMGASASISLSDPPPPAK